MAEILQRGETWALASGLFWALGVVLFKRAGEVVPPLPLNLFKNLVSLLFLVPFLCLLQGRLVPAWSGRTWMLLVVSGVLGITLADTLFFMALNRLGAGLNAVVDCLYFPLMAASAALVLGEPLTARAVVGGSLVIGAILVGSSGHRGAAAPRGQVGAGVCLGALGMLLMAVGVLLIDPLLDREPVLAVTTFRLLAGTVALVPLVWWGPQRAAFAHLLRPGRSWRVVVPASVVGGALAMWAWLMGFAGGEVAIAAILNQLSTIWIFVLAALILHEPITPRRAGALFLAFAGTLLVLAGG